MEPREAEVDRLLRRSMAAPVPSLPPDFEQRLMHQVRRSSPALDRYSRFLLIGYGLMSAVVSAIVLRGQGLSWGPTAGMILAPLALIAAASAAWHASHTAMRHSAKL